MTSLLLAASPIAYLLGYVLGVRWGVKRGRLLEQNDALAKRNARLRNLLNDIRDETCAEREAIAAMCALLGPREVDAE